MSDRDRQCGGYTCDALVRDGWLCRSCQRKAERALGDLPALTRDVQTTVSRQDHTSSGGKRGKGAEQPLVVNTETHDKGRVILELLFEWADFVAARNRMPGVPIFSRSIPLTTLVPQAVAMLLRYSEFMRLDEQGPDLVNAIHTVRRDLRRLVDQRPVRLYAGPCDADLGYPPEMHYRCTAALHRAWGRDDIVCDGHSPAAKRDEWHPTGCGHSHAVDSDRREWLTATVTDALLPLPLVLDAVATLHPDVTAKTAKQWTHERRTRIEERTVDGRLRARIIVTPPRLEPAGWAGDTPLYRGKDVLRLAAEERPRRGRKRTRAGEKMSA